MRIQPFILKKIIYLFINNKKRFLLKSKAVVHLLILIKNSTFVTFLQFPCQKICTSQNFFVSLHSISRSRTGPPERTIGYLNNGIECKSDPF